MGMVTVHQEKHVYLRLKSNWVKALRVENAKDPLSCFRGMLLPLLCFRREDGNKEVYFVRQRSTLTLPENQEQHEWHLYIIFETVGGENDKKSLAVKEHRSEIAVAVNRLWSCWGSIYCFQSWSPQGGKRSFFPANKRSTPGARNPTSFCPKECRWSLHWPCEKDEFHSRKTEMEILKKKTKNIQPIKNWISR